ncbi:hypothetical protein, partial [Vibrio vulnificus]|uniref:hypothetical protein n=1 Tax=Vibrio vulnificus TaxID=672 RepID=UPI0019554505
TALGSCSSSLRTRGSILKREDVFESITNQTKACRSAFAEEWIPACSGMTNVDSGKISYCPRLCLLASLLLVILANAGSILKREDVFESIKPTKSVRSALAEEWIPA